MEALLVSHDSKLMIHEIQQAEPRLVLADFLPHSFELGTDFQSLFIARIFYRVPFVSFQHVTGEPLSSIYVYEEK